MTSVLKKKLKKIEIVLFKLLRFDSPYYLYKIPTENNQKNMHAKLIDYYFNEQPGLLRLILTHLYLFIKKAIKFGLRKILERIR